MSNSEIRKSQSSDGGSIQPSDWRNILAQPKPGQEREKRITGLDVVFILDTTGSMYQYLEKVRQVLILPIRSTSVPPMFRLVSLHMATIATLILLMLQRL